MANLFTRIGKGFWENTFKAHPYAYSSVLVTGIACLIGGMAINGAQITKLRTERDHYKTRCENLDQRLLLVEKDNSQLKTRSIYLEGLLFISDNNNSKYWKILHEGAQVAREYGRALQTYADKLETGSNKIAGK